MKKQFYIYKLFLLAGFLFSGCYTVIWMPQDKFPTDYAADNYYYDEFYYGSYYPVDNSPWWLRFSPPSTPIGDTFNRKDNETTSSIRNEGSGRSTYKERPILITNPPSKESSGSSGSTGSTNTNSSSSSNSSNVNSKSNSGSRNSDNSSIRNNDGNRNTNSGRK